MSTAVVTVTVPDGVCAGQEFLLDYEGQTLNVICPDGCHSGMQIDLEVPCGGAAAGPLPALVDVAIPDGCFPGTEFTVEYGGQAFNIVVPDGFNPGENIAVEVPAPVSYSDGASAFSPCCAARGDSKPPTALKGPSPKAAMPRMELAEIPAFSGHRQAADGSLRDKPPASKYLAGLDIPAFRGPLKGVTANSVNAHAKWVSTGPATSLFDMMPDAGYGRKAGDFQVGQLVQVLRSSGTYTYGKVMDYDPSGDSYSIMTKAGPKYFVEKDDICAEDLIFNPHGGRARE